MADLPATSDEWLQALDELPENDIVPLATAAEEEDDGNDDSIGLTIAQQQERQQEQQQQQQQQRVPATSPPKTAANPKYMRPADFENTPMKEVVKPKGAHLPGIHAARPSFQERAAKAESAREPLPSIPGSNGIMTVEEAYDFLGVTADERGQLDKVKMRFRKMCLKWHPDKNRGREKAAAEVFQAANAAYHFLTTNNFDYKAWKASFTVPPMQSLDEVLMLALGGADPDKVEQLLKKRGEYRPHRDFGVNLSIPWNAGFADDPTYDVASGSAYTTTKKLEEGGGGAAGEGEGEGTALGTTAGADDEAYALAMEELVRRGGDLAKLRRMVLADASGSDIKNELKRLGYYKMGERARAISALKAAAAGRVATSPDEWGDGKGALVATKGGGGDGTARARAETRLAALATEEAMLNELAVVEAPRVRELGLYESHSQMYMERFGKQAELGANDDARPWEATALGREVHQPYKAPYVRARTYMTIGPHMPNAAEFAEKANDQAMEVRACTASALRSFAAHLLRSPRALASCTRHYALATCSHRSLRDLARALRRATAPRTISCATTPPARRSG